VILVTLIFTLFDAFSTITIDLTHSGYELNPILRNLLEVNPFLVYPYLLSFLIVILLFRFNYIVEHGVIVILFTVHFIASLNNIEVFFYDPFRFPRLMLLGLDVQLLAFFIGVTYVGGQSLYVVLRRGETRFMSTRTIFLNYLFYLMAYLVLNILSVVWGSLI